MRANPIWSYLGNVDTQLSLRDEGGEQTSVGGIGGCQIGYKHSATLEIFGKVFNCPIILVRMPHHELYHGLLGRDPIFNEFGFGFWEIAKELYVTEDP